MSYVAIVKKSQFTLSSNRRVIPKDDVKEIASIMEVSDQLAALLEKQGERLKQEQKQAYAEGFALGEEDGLKKAKEEYAEQLMAVSLLYQHKQAQLSEYAVTLALQIVRRIAEDVGPQTMVAAIANTASREFASETDILLRVHPDCVDSVRQGLEDFHLRMASSNSGDRRKSHFSKKSRLIDVRSDESLEPYDCMLVTEFGSTIASLEHQLERLRDVLTRELTLRLSSMDSHSYGDSEAQAV